MKKSAYVQQLDAINEYEFSPVPPEKHKGWKSFLGMYAGEHTAGTEFVIGPLFVVHGVSAIDLITGLLVGNVLAVFSWAFLTAPVATKTRLTLYALLEKITGKGLVKVYDVVNGLMFCFLAGSMIAVSASAIGIPFKIAMPGLDDWYPTGIGWVLIVFVVGAIITLIATLGYNQVSKFANITAPWMILIFIAAAVAVLPQLGIYSIQDFWHVAQTKIWTGIPLEGQSKFTFWHIMFFAWFCNMAMHIGMADITILRYAKKWQYGFASFGGMFLGHFIAWIASGILCAAALGNIVPGPIAYTSAGIAGIICVVLAGWTTANPTIYRAGLAFQAIFPKTKRWKVTIIVGIITTMAACFPALVMKLLDFVALYGLVLMPMGAVIIIDIYVLKKLNMASNYAQFKDIPISWQAAGAWVITLIFCLALNVYLGVDIFFLGLPGWFIAAGLYIILSKLIQSKNINYAH